MDIPSTTQRVNLNTAHDLNQKIENQTERNIAYYAANLAEIDTRLDELDREWDIERTLETHAAAVSLVSVAMGTLVSRKWFFIPALVGGFLLNHAVKGWCPPLSIFRRMGVRTQTEIDRERYALKALRGDFNEVSYTDISNDGNVAKVSRRVLKAVK